MQWQHEASLNWWNARRDVITATELASCVKAYNRAPEDQKEGRILFPPFASIWATKRSTRDPEVFSTGAAARGHIMEPYAIESYNASPSESRNPIFYHWDDCIIKNCGIGWSPDGLNVEQTTIKPELFVAFDGIKDKDGNLKISLPKSFIEIKSYSPDKHMKCMLTAPNKLDERYQMAAAFFTCHSLNEGCLFFYSPDTDLSFPIWYIREDLEEEIETISKMLDLWKKNVDGNLDKMEGRGGRIPSIMTEYEIHEDWIDKRDNWRY